MYTLLIQWSVKGSVTSLHGTKAQWGSINPSPHFYTTAVAVAFK
jgi:hypothetical protein